MNSTDLDSAFRRWRTNVLIGYVIILVGAAITYGDVQHEQAEQNRTTAKLAQVVKRQQADEQLGAEAHARERQNRTKNVGVWCHAINSLHVGALLPCKALERETLKSGN